MSMKRFRMYLKFTFAFPLLGAVSLSALSVVSTRGNSKAAIWGYITAGLFWAANVLEVVSVILCSGQRRYLENQSGRRRPSKAGVPGIVSFFGNREAMISDAVFFASAAAVAVLAWAKVRNEWAIIPCVIVLYISFYAHCLFNGKNYGFYGAVKDKNREESN